MFRENNHTAPGNGDERSSRVPGVYSERAKQVAANKQEWDRRACESDSFEQADYIRRTQINGEIPRYENGHLTF